MASSASEAILQLGNRQLASPNMSRAYWDDPALLLSVDEERSFLFQARAAMVIQANRWNLKQPCRSETLSPYQVMSSLAQTWCYKYKVCDWLNISSNGVQWRALANNLLVIGSMWCIHACGRHGDGQGTEGDEILTRTSRTSSCLQESGI